RSGEDIIWALRDVSLEIPEGQIVGVIGRNGAGKSTLLKILSRITEPTEGRAEIRGRVGSLLEVGTGFHPELTGRENIYLNGAILGMRKREIDRKFDEIVGFAEIDRFLDTPVKRYSSGMHVRLAFAVAAHLEPDILLVDEVLAVGDVAFQRKCMGKMSSVAQEGRTILFVSHNMSAIQNLCNRGIVISQGRMVFDGPAGQAVTEYLQDLTRSAESPFEENPHRRGDGSFRFTGARVLDDTGRESSFLVAGQAASFEFTYENRIGARSVQMAFTLYNQLGTAVANFNMDLTGYVAEGLGPQGKFICRVPTLPLPLGEYRGAVAVSVGGRTADLLPNVLVFTVESSTFFPTGRAPSPQYSACLVTHDWRHEPTSLADGAMPG
ncbi:MAG TPA: ABC transporter ATP-binding protein, partial [Thermoleophilia bacterium]|nr:ABC transporter ATP-binding protein [Thermoleophilia bacterium]